MGLRAWRAVVASLCLINFASFVACSTFPEESSDADASNRRAEASNGTLRVKMPQGKDGEFDTAQVRICSRNESVMADVNAWAQKSGSTDQTPSVDGFVESDASKGALIMRWPVATPGVDERAQWCKIVADQSFAYSPDEVHELTGLPPGRVIVHVALLRHDYVIEAGWSVADVSEIEPHDVSVAVYRVGGRLGVEIVRLGDLATGEASH